jgi:hypothetical protein
MKRFSLRYSLLTYKLDQLWFPLGLWALFVIVSLFLPDKLATIARGYLGFAIPLIGGILAAYAVLDDPAIELRFSTPVPALRTLLERLGLVLAIQAVGALGFQLFCLSRGLNLTLLGGGLGVQLAWLVPTLALMAIGVTGAFAAAQPMGGALLAGVLWLMELILRGWFVTDKIGRYFLVFMRAAYPDTAWLIPNEIAVVGWTIILFIAAWAMLRRQERYI